GAPLLGSDAGRPPPGGHQKAARKRSRFRCRRCGQSLPESVKEGLFELKGGVWRACGKTMTQATFLFTLKYPMRFSVSIPDCSGPSTYSTFGIFRFTVLSRLGRRES